MALLLEEDHPVPMEHLPMEVADHQAPMVHRQMVVEDLRALTELLQALMVLLQTEAEAEASVVAEFPQAMVPHRVAHHQHMEHHLQAAEAFLLAMVHLPEAVVVAADTQDHLRLTVHLAPVVAVSEAPADTLVAEVDTLEAVVATLEEVMVATLEAATVVTPAAVATLEAVAEAIPVEVVATPVAVVAIPEVVVVTPAVVATLEAAEVTVATLEEAEVVTLEAVVAIPEVAAVATPGAVAAATPAVEVVRATPATEVTNINSKKSSPRATTFDGVSSIIHHQANLKNSTSSILRSRHKKIIQNANLRRTNGTSTDKKGENETESEVIVAKSKSSPRHPGSALKV